MYEQIQIFGGGGVRDNFVFQGSRIPPPEPLPVKVPVHLEILHGFLERQSKELCDCWVSKHLFLADI